MSDDLGQDKSNDVVGKLYLDAVEALKKLRDAIDDSTGLDSTVEQAFSEVIREKKYQDFVKRNGQEREETTISASKLPLGTFGSGEHRSFWVENGETYKYVEQPYELGWKTLQRLVERCKEANLEASISARKSWHFPSWTLLVEVFPSVEKSVEASPEKRSTSFEDVAQASSNAITRKEALKKGYHQGWKDALDSMRSIMTKHGNTYPEAENSCYEYWRSSLLSWMRDEQSSEVPRT